MSIDFRECLYALSDVVMNRPPPLRIVDQIYMKLPDMLLQSELIARWFDRKQVIFIGDGDAIALAVCYLGKQGLLPGVPDHVTVLDFDERVINSITSFAKRKGISDLIVAELYNVADPLPEPHWQNHDAFYTNPPWGASNSGRSVSAFVRRGVECVGPAALGCIVIGDHPQYDWTHEVLLMIQAEARTHGFRVAEMLPHFHKYHLDDDPDLTSCCMIISRRVGERMSYSSEILPKEDMHNFYGEEAPLLYHYIRDKTNGGKFPSRDFEVEEFPSGGSS